MSKITDKVQEALEPIVNELGYDIVEVEYAKKVDGYNLTVFIDSKNGISLDDCEKVHNAIDEPLDELDPTNGESYTLNVSSPGLDRPLKTDKDFERNLGNTLEVSLYAAVKKCKNFVGELVSFDENSITIKTKKEEIKFEKSSIAKVCKYIEF